MPKRLLLHLGLHKTATTYLQKSVWPAWDAIGYAGRPTPRGHATSEQAVFSINRDVILMSNESSGGSLKRSYLRNQSWADLRRRKLEEIRGMYAGKFELRVIIGLRKPEPWILSLYKHYLKYGGVDSLEEFLGIGADRKPTLDHADLLNMPKIRQIEESLGVAPFCFFLEEIKSDPEGLSQALASYAGVADGPKFPKDAVFNEGVDQHEAERCLAINRMIVNPGCRQKGYLRRNKTLGFDWVRRMGKLGFSRKPSPPLSISPEASAFIDKLTGQDLLETIGYIARSRSEPGSTVPNQEPRLREIIFGAAQRKNEP